MLRKVSFVAGLALLAGLVPAAAHAQDYGFQAKDYEVTLSGSGANDRKFQSGSFGANGSIGYFLTKDLEVALRQNVNYANAKGSSEQWTATTKLALDYHFHLGRFTPFIGANIGYVYGEHISDTFEAAPEVGVKYFVNSTTFIYATAEYEFYFKNGGRAASGFRNGEFVYTLGMGFRFQ